MSKTIHIVSCSFRSALRTPILCAQGRYNIVLVTAYQIFRATETLPNREVLLDSINRVLSTVGYDKMNLGIVEEDINLESIKGANTDDITNG